MHRFKKLFFAYLLMITPLFSSDTKEQEQYRVFDDTTKEHVKKFYLLNHTHQTLDFVLQKEKEHLTLNHKKMGIFEAIAEMDKLIDASDPDIDLPQSYHCYQTAEALRKDGYPRWMILTGFIHDLGKILALYGEPQWAVVGDTFPVGCAYSKDVVFSEYFEQNADIQVIDFQTPLGIYHKGCGFSNLHMSFGHDEYLYHVVKNYLPKEASYIIRFHSFYAAHDKNAYQYFMDDYDKEMLPLLKTFSRYDLYSKTSEKLDIAALKPYYEELIAEFFPVSIDW